MSAPNSVAIVTGGGTGVGAATSMQLAKRGWSVVVNYSRSKAEAESTVAEILASGGRAIAVEANVADDAACRAMVARTIETYGRVDLLVNCAGTTDFIPFGELDQVTDEVWQRIYQVNVIGAFHCARAVREPMLASGGGQIINVSEALHTSSFLMERYLDAADKALSMAIANLPQPPRVQQRDTLKDERQVKTATESVYRRRDDSVVMFSSSG